MNKGRSAYTLIESLVALTIMAGAGMVFAQVLTTLATQRRSVEQHLLASTEAANVLEEQLALPLNDKDAPVRREVALAEPIQFVLREAICRVETHSIKEGELRSERVTVTVEWRQDTATKPRQVQFVGYKFAKGAAP